MKKEGDSKLREHYFLIFHSSFFIFNFETVLKSRLSYFCVACYCYNKTTCFFEDILKERAGEIKKAGILQCLKG